MHYMEHEFILKPSFIFDFYRQKTHHTLWEVSYCQKQKNTKQNKKQ